MCFFFNPGPVWRVPIPNRYTAKAKLCFCKNNKRTIIMLPWQMTCHIGAKDMSVTFKIMTEGVRLQFVKLFPRGMTDGVGPVGISAGGW